MQYFNQTFPSFNISEMYQVFHATTADEINRKMNCYQVNEFQQ